MVEQLRLRQNRQRLQVITLLQLVIHHNRKVISHNLLLMAINLLMTKSLKTISRMEKKDGDKPEGAPEKYEFQAAEGVELDTEALKEFEPVARELNLTNEQAQKLVDAYPKILAGVQQRQAEAWQKTTEQWAADVKADKEIGGDKLISNLSAAQRALDQFGTPELKEYLNTTGLGNHPDLVKTFVKIGKAMSEDGMVTGGNEGQRSAAEVLYGK